MAGKVKPRTPRGMRDFLPEKMILRQYVIDVIREVFEEFGFEPLHFAIIVILCLIIGTITPPVGLLLFVVSGVSKIPIKKVGFTIWPFIFAMVAIVVLIAYFPQIALFLPNLL